MSWRSSSRAPPSIGCWTRGGARSTTTTLKVRRRRKSLKITWLNRDADRVSRSLRAVLDLFVHEQFITQGRAPEHVLVFVSDDGRSLTMEALGAAHQQQQHEVAA